MNIFNQDIITNEAGEPEYNPSFIDNAIATEDDPDREIVLNGIMQIAQIFDNVDSVRESHGTVKSILRHAGFADWWGFYDYFSEEINTAFANVNEARAKHIDPTPDIPSLANAPVLTRKSDSAFLTAYAKAAEKMLSNLTRDKTSLTGEINELEDEIVSATLKLKEISDHLLEITPIKSTTKKSEECEKLEKLQERIKAKLPKLQQERAIQVKKLDAILAQADLTTSQLQLLENDGINEVINISTGDFATDADTHAAIAKNCTFRIGYGLHALCNMRTRQFRENAESGGHYSIREIMDASGGVYDNDNIENRISKAETEITRLTRVYAACAIQYHLLSSYPRDPSAYWPRFEDNFWASVCISRQRAIVSSTKKRDELREAEQEMAERGAWRIPAM